MLIKRIARKLRVLRVTVWNAARSGERSFHNHLGKMFTRYVKGRVFPSVESRQKSA